MEEKNEERHLWGYIEIPYGAAVEKFSSPWSLSNYV